MIFPITTSSLQLWKQERIVGYKHTTRKVRFWTDLEGSGSNPIAVYTPTSDGELYIDLTDYVRAHEDVEEFHFYEAAGGVHIQTDIAVSVVGLINPASVLVPCFGEEADFYFDMPRRYLSPLTGASLQFGIFPRPSGDDSLFYYIRTTYWPASTQNVSDGMTLTSTYSNGFHLMKSEGGTSTILRTYRPTPLIYGVNYAMVRWVSFTGTTRCHTMEVVKSKIETKDAYSLLPIDNEYVEIKGREDGFTLRLNGLCAYDIWYYADMITSSKAEVSLDGSTWDRVQVTKKSITMPDGEGSDGVLEIQVNWKRYDAVAM